MLPRAPHSDATRSASSDAGRGLVFTVCSANYLGKALALCRSALTHNPGLDTLILLADRKRPLVLSDTRIRIVWAEDLGFPQFLQCAFKYNIIELNTALKPFAARRFLADYGKVVYLDPDVCVFSPLVSVLQSLDSSSAVFTPHALSPYGGGGRPSDQDLLRFGCFNLGFFAVSDTPPAHALLDWWHDRCLSQCFYEPQLGLGVDQKWIDLAPAFFDRVGILKDPGLNVAFWNLHEREIVHTGAGWFVDGQTPLGFVHFSSFVETDRSVVADKQTRHAPGTRPDFAAAADAYREQLKAAQALASIEPTYGFATFDNGQSISPALRRAYATQQHRFSHVEDPFRADGAVHAFARSMSLLSSKPASTGHKNFKVVSGYGRQQRIIARVFRAALRLLGPDRYFLLMRYLGHYSSILNQADIFGR